MATVTNLTNTTWVFKLSKLNFQHWVLKKINIVFISKSTTYSAMSCKIHAYESSIGKYCDSLYYETPNTSELAYRCEYVGNSYDVDRYTLNVNNVPLTIIDGDVFNSSLIKFLSNNATCQTTLVTVTFNMNGKGTAVDSQTFASGEKVIMPIITPDDNYIFAGWYTDSGLTTAFDFSTSVTSNITLYAKWIPKAIKTKVSGAWNSGTPLVKANNTWKDADKVFVKVDGVWQPVIDNEQPSPVKCAEFSTASDNYLNNSNFFVSKYGNASWLSFKILTNNSFSFNIGVYFDDAANWWNVGIHNSNTPTVDNNSVEIDNEITFGENTGISTINIPSGNINKYIVIGFSTAEQGMLKNSFFRFLSNYYDGAIYLENYYYLPPTHSFTISNTTFFCEYGMTFEDWVNSSFNAPSSYYTITMPSAPSSDYKTPSRYTNGFIITDDMYYSSDLVAIGDCDNYDGVLVCDVIIDGATKDTVIQPNHVYSLVITDAYR